MTRTLVFKRESYAIAQETLEVVLAANKLNERAIK